MVVAPHVQVSLKGNRSCNCCAQIEIEHVRTAGKPSHSHLRTPAMSHQETLAEVRGWSNKELRDK